jgi:hypothetical protein
MRFQELGVGNPLKHVTAPVALKPDFRRRVAYTCSYENPAPERIARFRNYPGMVFCISTLADFLIIAI